MSADPVIPDTAWQAMTSRVEAAFAQRRVPIARLWRWRLRRTLVLVGPMGAGKSAVGRAVARMCGCVHLDSDALLTSLLGPIPAYFAEHGESAFRAAEARVMAYLTALPQTYVLSCGGGVVLDEDTRAAMRRRADTTVFHLDVAEAEALRRVRGGASRPALQGDPGGTWKRLRDERGPLYAEVADVSIDTTGLTAEAVAWRIVDTIRHPRRK